MNSFGHYSRYYNLLYGDKDYQAEAAFVDDLIQKYAPSAEDLLDLGCGTGRHAISLAKKYSVTGVDISDSMLAVARSCCPSEGGPTPSLHFFQGDIRAFRLNRHFDVIISLFHVMSYQTSNDDLMSAFTTARVHLKAGGIFIFDCWYGPAVLTERPVVRVKRLENERTQIIRIADPIMHPNKNRVDVNYTLWVRDKDSNTLEEIKETHEVRYWFMPEILSFLERSGFRFIESREWMTGKEPGLGTWSVYFVGQG
jgi:SAM-dependent methyltransferase